MGPRPVRPKLSTDHDLLPHDLWRVRSGADDAHERKLQYETQYSAGKRLEGPHDDRRHERLENRETTNE